MLEDPYITQMNIDRYTAMLKLHPADESRAYQAITRGHELPAC
jgi:hypothetical protein